MTRTFEIRVDYADERTETVTVPASTYEFAFKYNHRYDSEPMFKIFLRNVRKAAGASVGPDLPPALAS